MALSNEQITVIFKALCDENRVQIFRFLQHGERCACHLLEEMHLSQPTLSHHMKILCDSGLVNGRKEGKWMHYSISAEGARIAMDCLKKITAVTENNSKCCNNQ